MNSVAKKSTFSELFLITPAIYSALLKVIKDRGQLKELQDLNANTLSSSGFDSESSSNAIVSQVNPNTGLIEQSVPNSTISEDPIANNSTTMTDTGTQSNIQHQISTPILDSVNDSKTTQTPPGVQLARTQTLKNLKRTMESQTETPKTSSLPTQTNSIDSKTISSQTEPTNKTNSSIGTQTDQQKLVEKKSMREKIFLCNICPKKFTS